MDDDDIDESARWELHPITRRAARYLERQLTLARLELEGACATTNDPKVAMAYGRWCAIHQELQFFKNRNVRIAALKQQDNES